MFALTLEENTLCEQRKILKSYPELDFYVQVLPEDYLDDLRDKFCQKEIDAQTLVASGPVVETINRVAESENADLIAIASHGRTGLSRVFYGSVAAGILHRVDRPLLLIRSD